MNNSQATYLDILRGFAAQLVLLGHLYSMLLFPGNTLGIGDLGVIIFFILSGFLITYTTLLKKHRGNYSAVNYFSDRFFRIFVPYFPAIVFIIALDSYVFYYTDVQEYLEYYSLKNLIATLTMLQQHPIGLFMDKLMGMSEMKLSTFGSGRPLWTVASEWWLYMVFGFIFFYKQFKHRYLFLVTLLIVAIVPLFNSVAGTGQGLSLVWFLMSGLAYLYYHYGKSLGKKVVVLKAGIQEKLLFSLFLFCLLLLMVVRIFWISYVETGFTFERPILYDFNFYLLLMAFLSLLFIILGSVQIRVRNKLLMFLADYSYSLYLIHYTWIFFLLSIGFTVENKWYGFILYYVSANLVAISFWWLFERHHRIVKLFVTQLLFSGR